MLSDPLNSVTSTSPDPDGAVGTIGVAERHQTEQIASADIVLDDTTIQELLQSDDVQRLIADATFTKLFARPEIQAALANPAWRIEIVVTAAQKAP